MLSRGHGFSLLVNETQHWCSKGEVRSLSLTIDLQELLKNKSLGECIWRRAPGQEKLRRKRRDRDEGSWYASGPTTMVVYTIQSAWEKCQLSNLLLSAIFVHHHHFGTQEEHYGYKGGGPVALALSQRPSFQLPSQISKSADSTPSLL